jgi:hypothetical protein
MRRVVTVVIASATLLLLSSTAGLTNDKEPALTVASHGDPFASCVGIGANSIGVNYPDTELEPWVAANPANRRNLLLQQRPELDVGTPAVQRVRCPLLRRERAPL